MQYQQTLKEKIERWGIEPFGGCPVKITINPAPENTGIIFKSSKGSVPATLDNTEPIKGLAKFLTLKNKNARIFVPEHLLATLFGYEIDNAEITLEKIPSLSYEILKYFGKGKNTEVVPYFGKKICDALDNNILEQNKPRKTLRLKEKIETERLTIEPIGGEEIIIKALTDYRLARGKRIKQEKEILLSPQAIKEISIARNYCGTVSWVPKGVTKTAGYLLYLSFGFGYGCEESNLFYPRRSREEWQGWELMDNEIACHTILDRIGDTLALLPGRPSGIKLTCRFAGHKDAIETIKAYRDYFEEVE